MSKKLLKAASKTEHRLLSLDPGSVNFGLSFLKISRTQYKIVRCGMMTQLMKDLKSGTQEDSKQFSSQLSRILRRSKPTDVIAERYVARIRGATIESVNMMLGLTMAAVNNIPGNRMHILMAATWKNCLNKFFCIEDFYKECKPVPDHAVDATLIGFYFAHKSLNFGLARFSKPRARTILANQIKRSYIKLK
jgi:hypothetical protein